MVPCSTKRRGAVGVQATVRRDSPRAPLPRYQMSATNHWRSGRSHSLVLLMGGVCVCV